MSAEASTGAAGHHRVFERLRKAFCPEAAVGERLTAQLVLSGEAGGHLWVDIRDGRLEAGPGDLAAPDLTFHLSAEDFCGVLEGRVNPDLLFLGDSFRVEGDLSRALELRKLFRAPV